MFTFEESVESLPLQVKGNLLYAIVHQLRYEVPWKKNGMQEKLVERNKSERVLKTRVRTVRRLPANPKGSRRQDPSDPETRP